MCVVLQGVADVSFYFFRVYFFSLASKLLQFHRQAFVVQFLNVIYVICNIVECSNSLHVLITVTLYELLISTWYVWPVVYYYIILLNDLRRTQVDNFSLKSTTNPD